VRATIFAEENRRWWTLGALCFALFMIMLDNTVVNVALPAIKKDLGVTQAELEWTVAAYALTFASLLLTGGKLGDLLGRRLIFAIGLVVVLAAIFVVPESKDTSRDQRLDLPGLITSAVALFSIVFALIEAHRYGWTSTLILSLFALGALSLAAFILLEMHQRAPMLDLS